MRGKPGPFKIIECHGDGVIENPIAAPFRDYSCPNYQVCLDLAAALNWDTFTCRGCSKEIDEALYWQAHHAQKHDRVANKICHIPGLRYLEPNGRSKKVASGGE